MENRKPLILVSNDDGFRARGVHELTRVLMKFANVIAVCPQGPQSGKSMSITVNDPLRITHLEDYAVEEPGVEWYAVNGSPVDCIKLAMHTILGERRPDLVCTGINHGSNAAVNVLYSGTMGAAFEGAVFGIPAIGFSLCDHSHNADFSKMLPYVKLIVEDVLREGLPKDVCLNVNAPIGELKGAKYTKSCVGHWSDEYKQYIDPAGKPYYWLTGSFINDNPEDKDTDEYLLSQGYISIVACNLDRTAPIPRGLTNIFTSENICK